MNPTRESIREGWRALLDAIPTASTAELERSVHHFLRDTATSGGPQPPRLDADEAVACIQSGDSVYVGARICTPPDLSAALARRCRHLQRVQLQCVGLAADSPLLDPDLTDHLRITSYFVFSSTLRERIASGQADYVPVRLSELFALSHHNTGADVCLVRTSPPDARGMLSLSTQAGPNMGKLLTSRRVIAEIDPGIVPMPGFTSVPVSAVDAIVESSHRHTPGRAAPRTCAPDPLYEAIASNAAAWIDDGATLQVGVGRFLPHLLEALAHKKHLGFHGSFLNHDVLELIKGGTIDNSRKGCFDGVSIVGSAALTTELIEFNQATASIHFYPAEFFAHAALLAHHKAFVSITGALEVDLTGQVGSESLGTRIYSGLGSQQDFMWGSQLSPRGKTMILLPSTVKGGSESRICVQKRSGSGQTSSRGDIDVIVTEHGSAALKGKSIAERALALIDLAAPPFRQALHDAFFFIGRSDAYHRQKPR